ASPIAAATGDCGGCSLDLDAGGTITTTTAASLDVHATGISGDGGLITVFAGGNITLAGHTFGDGTGTDEEGGGAGGELDVISDNGNITVSGLTDLNGAPPDGDGGTVDLEATNGTLSQTAKITAHSVGFGGSDDVFLLSGGNMSITNIDISG